MLHSLAQDFCVTPELESCGLDLQKAEADSCSPPADIKSHRSNRMPSKDSWVIVIFSLKHDRQPWKLLTLTFPERLQKSFWTPVNPNNMTFKRKLVTRCAEMIRKQILTCHTRRLKTIYLQRNFRIWRFAFIYHSPQECHTKMLICPV